MLQCKGELAQRQHIIRARRGCNGQGFLQKDHVREPPSKGPLPFICFASSSSSLILTKGLLQFIPQTRNKNGERPWHGFPSTGLLGLSCRLPFLAPSRQRQKWYQLCSEEAKRRAALPRARSFGHSGQAKSHSFARGSLSFQPQDSEEELSRGVPCGWPHEQLCCQVDSAPCQQSLSPAPTMRLERPLRAGPPRQGGRSGRSWMESERRAAGSSSRADSTTSPSGSLEEILGVEVEVGCVGGCFRWTPRIPGFPVWGERESEGTGH